jgi:hypothetical protein
MMVVALSLLACQETTLAVRVVTPRDGGSPFSGDGAATQARFRIDDGVSNTTTVNVAPNGYFALDLTISNSPRAAPGVLEALRGNDVMGSGATPALEWNRLGPVVVSLFVQRRDSLVLYPWSFVRPRTAPQLFEVAPSFIVAVGGSSVSEPIESFNQALLAGASDGAVFDTSFGREASFVRLGNGNLMAIRGCMALVWNPSTNAAPTAPMAMSMMMPPPERCDVTQSTVVQEPAGGAMLLGGRGPSGPVARVDVIAADGAWSMALPMAAPRVRPAAVRTGPNEALIAGGQVEAPLLERYTRTLAADRRVLRTGNATIDQRRDVALVAVDQGIVLALGGSVLGSTDLVADDVVLDTRCLDGGCPLVVATRPLLRERRRDAVAALATDGRVVVASGAGVGGVAASVELLDASSPRAPVWVGTVGTIPFDGITALRLSTGSVLFAGGGRNETWTFRH